MLFYVYYVLAILYCYQLDGEIRDFVYKYTLMYYTQQNFNTISLYNYVQNAFYTYLYRECKRLGSHSAF